MAEGDNRVRTTDAASRDVELRPGTDKADPIDKPRLPEDLARASYYAGTGTGYAELSQRQKDELPEHQARRDAYPLITSST